MTREELKEHCKRQIQQFERVKKIMPVTPNDWKRYEEHKLVLELLEQEPFINKPCVSSGVCEHDKQKVLNKIRAEIMQVANQEKFHDAKWALGLRYAVNIIDKYKAEREAEDGSLSEQR